jgi:hypothetical protein
LCLFGLYLGNITAQTDSLMRAISLESNIKPEKITQARAYLKSAFENEDLGLVNAWLGFLEKDLDDEEYAATLADERWLLYYWTGNYALLFSEAGNYTNLVNEKIQYQEPPNPDGLFELVDKESYNRRFELVKNMQTGFLSEDEKAFGSLLLDYLLRLDDNAALKREKNEKITNFIKKYPKSRFKQYALNYMFDGETAKKRSWGFDMMANYGRNSQLLGANFKPYYAFNFGVIYGWKKFDFGFRTHFGTQKVRRGFYDGILYFVPDSNAIVIDLGLETSYALLNSKELKIAPFVGAGFNMLGVTSDNFTSGDFGKTFFKSPSWTTGISVDFKQITKKSSSFTPKSPYTCLKVRLGYRGLYHQNEALRGSQIFVGVGIVFRS